MVCQQCHQPNPSDSLFCGYCGVASTENQAIVHVNSDLTNPRFSVIPKRTLSLLYFSDKEPSEIVLPSTIMLSFDLVSAKATRVMSDDPSTIFTKLPIDVPTENEKSKDIGYFPTYSELSDGQKGYYLWWLRDVRQEIGPGYVFIYYYGLERQLVTGNFDDAFEEIRLLRRFHKNPSFQSYSQGALVTASFLRSRSDKLIELFDANEIKSLDNLEIMVAHHLGYDLTAESLMLLARRYPDLNKRYVKSRPDLFQHNLTAELCQNFGNNYFPWKSILGIDAMKTTSTIAFANVTLSDNLRCVDVPDIVGYEPFLKRVEDLWSVAHEKTKEALRAERKESRSIAHKNNKARN